MIMNLVPLASIFITFASTVGAALWASDIERRIQGPVPTFDIFEEDEACTSPADVFGRTLAKGGIVAAGESTAAVERERNESRG